MLTTAFEALTPLNRPIMVLALRGLFDIADRRKVRRPNRQEHRSMRLRPVGKVVIQSLKLRVHGLDAVDAATGVRMFDPTPESGAKIESIVVTL